MKEQKLFFIISVSIDFMEGGTQESRQALSAPGTQTSRRRKINKIHKIYGHKCLIS